MTTPSNISAAEQNEAGRVSDAIGAAFDDFIRAFEVFKSENDARLTKLERTHISYPQSAEEAEAMEKAGYHYLAANNPERLTDLAKQNTALLAELEEAKARADDLVHMLEVSQGFVRASLNEEDLPRLVAEARSNFLIESDQVIAGGKPWSDGRPPISPHSRGASK